MAWPLVGKRRYVLVKYVRRKIRLIESNARCLYLKELTCKGTLRQVFYLSEAPPPLHTVYSIYCTVRYCILIHTGKGGRGGGELTREKVRGTIL
jgi:hypothetical protein